jgi:hypothetical protein
MAVHPDIVAKLFEQLNVYAGHRFAGLGVPVVFTYAHVSEQFSPYARCNAIAGFSLSASAASFSAESRATSANVSADFFRSFAEQAVLAKCHQNLLDQLPPGLSARDLALTRLTAGTVDELLKLIAIGELGEVLKLAGARQGVYAWDVLKYLASNMPKVEFA